MGFFARQLRSVIQWENPSADVLVERWSENGDEIKNASALIVGPGQGCIFVYEGRVQGVFSEPGLHRIRTSNHPFVTTLVKVMQSFTSEHKVGMYFYRSAKILNLKWGTESPIKYEDPIYKFPVGLRAFGNYSMRIQDPSAFFQQVVAGSTPFLADHIRQPLNARLVQPLSDFFAEAGYTYTQIDPNREEIAAALVLKLKDELHDLGFVLDDFRIEGTSFDEDTMRRVSRIADVHAEAHAASTAGVGYAELQQLEAMREAARNPGGGGAMAMAVGMNLAGAVPLRSPQEDPSSKLKKLKALLDEQLITQEEYEEKRRDILRSL